jgi:small multidrug resistance pump
MRPAFVTYGSLAIAILFEVFATYLLQQSQQFTRPLRTVGLALFYSASFYCLSITLTRMPVGIAYAIWSGLGIVLISTIGYFALGQSLDTAAIVGLAFIIIGVVIVNVLSGAAPH